VQRRKGANPICERKNADASIRFNRFVAAAGEYWKPQGKRKFKVPAPGYGKKRGGRAGSPAARPNRAGDSSRPIKRGKTSG